ncbi:hypothetical protein CEXT_785131 [Caerostris extrusa]|uniref:Uncharacterized protein n=1 Tax=Caerostris extrusa TaxID=172846 RepID=A0AAV4RTC1_CAEEX|nr:hypothetical protein CEXT_785131 [Caerostris extrusa]
MQDTLRHILLPLQDKCITSGQIFQVGQLVYLREHYTIFLNDTADMKRTSSSADTIHYSDCKILEFYNRNNSQVRHRISQAILYLQFCIYLLYRNAA